MFSDPEFLKLAIGAATALGGAAWTAFVYFDKRGQKGGGGDQSGSNQSTVIINSLPRGAVVLMLAGVVLIGFVLMTAEEGGDQVNTGNESTVVTGDGASATVNSGTQINAGDGAAVSTSGNATSVNATNGIAGGRDVNVGNFTITNGN